VGDEKLKMKFPRLYSVSVYNERVVSDFGMWNRDFYLANTVEEGFVLLGERFGKTTHGPNN